MAGERSVIVVGGGFAGVGCAKELAKHDVAVTLLDRHNYHQFQPLPTKSRPASWPSATWLDHSGESSPRTSPSR